MIRIGVLGPSEIAERRFLPALEQSEKAVFAGVACASAEERSGKADEAYIASRREKCRDLAERFGGAAFDSFDELLKSGEVDAVYIPLPPAIHERWALRAIERGLHVLLEKPSSTSLAATERIIVIMNNRDSEAQVEIPLWMTGISRTDPNTEVVCLFETDNSGYSARRYKVRAPGGVLKAQIAPKSTLVLYHTDHHSRRESLSQRPDFRLEAGQRTRRTYTGPRQPGRKNRQTIRK